MMRVKFNIYHAVTGSQSIIPAKRVFTYGLEWTMEVKVLLYDDEWPESLHEKLKGFVVKESDE